MKKFERLDAAAAPDGTVLTLYGHDGAYVIRVGGVELMSTRRHHSERRLAELVCAPLRQTPRARVLVGGLGLGFTLRVVLVPGRGRPNRGRGVAPRGPPGVLVGGRRPGTRRRAAPGGASRGGDTRAGARHGRPPAYPVRGAPLLTTRRRSAELRRGRWWGGRPRPPTRAAASATSAGTRLRHRRPPRAVRRSGTSRPARPRGAARPRRPTPAAGRGAAPPALRPRAGVGRRARARA